MAVVICPLHSWHMSSIFRFRVLGYSATLEKAWRGVKWSQSQFHSSTPHSQPTTKRIFPFVWSSLMIWPCCRTCRSFRCPMLPETMCHRPVLYVRTIVTMLRATNLQSTPPSDSGSIFPCASHCQAWPAAQKQIPQSHSRQLLLLRSPPCPARIK